MGNKVQSGASQPGAAEAVWELPNYVNGAHVVSKTEEWRDVINPSTGELVARAPLSTAAEVDAAVETAASAFATWGRTSISARVQPIFRLASLVRQGREELARSISEEMGKSLPDARAEMDRAIQNCETACAMPMLQQGTRIIGVADGIDGETFRRPLGVCALGAPFNFPAMVPFWFFPYAIAAGNTFVIKPSEKAPLTLTRLLGCIEAAGFPPGVVNLLHGDGRVMERLIDHPEVRAVSVVGSTPVCRAVATRSVGAGKRYQAFGGAKNHLVVMPDAPIDLAVRNMITSCYGCAGQRCMAASVIVAVGDEAYGTVTEQFIAASREVRIADPLDPAVAEESVLMGPVVSQQAKDFILEMIAAGAAEGATLALDGRECVVPGRERGCFVGPTVFTDVRPGMRIHTTEIFGPVVCIMKAESLDDAIDIINAHPYGNGASIYTRNAAAAREFKLNARVGMVGINVGIPAPVAYLPFGGDKASMLCSIKTQGAAIVDFYTDQVSVTERVWPE